MYFGHFKQHARDGDGTMLDDAHNEIYSGRWSKDKPTTKGVSALTMRIPETFITLK